MKRAPLLGAGLLAFATTCKNPIMQSANERGSMQGSSVSKAIENECLKTARLHLEEISSRMNEVELAGCANRDQIAAIFALDEGFRKELNLCPRDEFREAYVGIAEDLAEVNSQYARLEEEGKDRRCGKSSWINRSE